MAKLLLWITVPNLVIFRKKRLVLLKSLTQFFQVNFKISIVKLTQALNFTQTAQRAKDFVLE